MSKGFISLSRLSFGPWQAFERMIARYLEHVGTTDVSVVGGSGDHGSDVVGTVGSDSLIVQAKFKSSGTIDQAAIMELINASPYYQADVYFAATNQKFSPKALAKVEELKRLNYPIRLWDRSYWINEYEKLEDLSSARSEPRDYQIKAIEAVQEHRAKGHTAALILMATGLGKSIVAATIAEHHLQRHPSDEILVLCQMNGLAEQLEKSFWPQLPKSVTTHLWCGGEKPAYPGGITFATWQSVEAAQKTGEDLSKRFGIVIVDEAHHAVSDNYLQVIAGLESSFLIGLTATPWRQDKRTLTSAFGEPVFSIDIVEGMKRGYLAKVDYRLITGGIDWETIHLASKQGLTVKDLNRLLIVPDRDDAAVGQIVETMATLSDPKVLIFCRSIEHADQVRARFRSYDVVAESIHSQLSRHERFRVLSNFRSGGTQVLISIEMLNEGIDIPDVNLIAFMRVTHSRRIFVQQLGRGLRLRSGKTEVVVLDFAADIRRVAAVTKLNRDLHDDRGEIEIIPSGKFGSFQFDEPSNMKLFDEYLADVADLEEIDDSQPLRFPSDLTKDMI